MSQRILVVEDQEDLRAILRDFLSASGYTVIEAADGADSVAKAASDHPDLVLMDIQLPMQNEVPIFEAAGYLGMSPTTLQEVYGHHSPSFQDRAAGYTPAISNKKRAAG